MKIQVGMWEARGVQEEALVVGWHFMSVCNTHRRAPAYSKLSIGSDKAQHHYLGLSSWFQLLQLLGGSLNSSCCPQQFILRNDGGVFWVHPLCP